MNDDIQSSYEPAGRPTLSSDAYGRHSSKKKWLLLGLALIILIIAGAVFALLMKDKPTNPAATAISSTVANVSITAKGYVPSSTKVHIGQEITWTNNDTTPHHLLADQTDLPGFDTPDSLDPGDSYTYIFDKAGTYHYYDAADAKTYVGTVIVE